MDTPGSEQLAVQSRDWPWSTLGYQTRSKHKTETTLVFKYRELVTQLKEELESQQGQ